MGHLLKWNIPISHKGKWKKYTYWKVFHCISKPILGVDPYIKQFGGSCPYYCPVIRNIYKVQASMSPGFRQGEMKLPLVYFSSIVPDLVFFSTRIAKANLSWSFLFGWFGLVWLTRAVKLTFSSTWSCQHLQSFPFCLLYHRRSGPSQSGL